MNRLAPLSEEPGDEQDKSKKKSKKGQSWPNWFKNQLPLFFNKKSDLKILLSVLGCPLFPVFLQPGGPPRNNVAVVSRAQYIIQQLRAASGIAKVHNGKEKKSMYAIGKVKMAIKKAAEDHPHVLNTQEEQGCFVMWQMVPDKWLIELVVSGQKVVAGCDGNMAWRHTPWLGAHAAKGAGIRPLRRSLQGLDPETVGAVFSTAEFMGEKEIGKESCFVLKVSVDQRALAEQSDNTADIIKHVIMGYFSQRSGLLVHLQDSQLTRIQSPGTNPTYWETTIGSKLEDYRDVDGVMIAHSGQSNVTLTRFGNNVNQIMRMEETWNMEDVVFNVPGLSLDCFIPPEEVREKKI